MQERPLRYYNFILSLWQEEGTPTAWRFSLQNSQTVERQGFKDLAELLHFLDQWMADELPEGPHDNES